MTRSCIGRCITHPLVGQQKRSRDMYKDGKIYCKTCEYCAFYEGVWCPCCANRMRRNPVSNRMIILVKEIKRI
jgi:hypothetical protein